MGKKRNESNNVAQVTAANAFDNRIERMAKNAGPLIERNWAGELHMAGRKAYYEEYFNQIPVSEQDIPSIGPISDPRTAYNFKEGYKKGIFLVGQGIIPEEYQNKPKQR